MISPRCLSADLVDEVPDRGTQTPTPCDDSCGDDIVGDHTEDVCRDDLTVEMIRKRRRPITFDGGEFIVSTGLIIDNVVVPVVTKDGADFTPFGVSQNRHREMWWANVLGIATRRIDKQWLETSSIIGELMAALTIARRQRSQLVRKKTTTGGCQDTTVEVTCRGFTLCILNDLRSLYVTSTKEQVQWIIRQLHHDMYHCMASPGTSMSGGSISAVTAGSSNDDDRDTAPTEPEPDESADITDATILDKLMYELKSNLSHGVFWSSSRSEFVVKRDGALVRFHVRQKYARLGSIERCAELKFQRHRAESFEKDGELIQNVGEPDTSAIQTLLNDGGMLATL